MKILILIFSVIAPLTTVFAGVLQIRLVHVCESLHNKTLPAGCKATCMVENGIPGQSSSKYTLTITKGAKSAHLIAEEVSMGQKLIANDRMYINASDATQNVNLAMTIDRDNDVTELQLNEIVCK